MQEEPEIINIHSDKDYGVKWNSLVHEESEPVEVEDGQFMRSYTRKVDINARADGDEVR